MLSLLLTFVLLTFLLFLHVVLLHKLRISELPASVDEDDAVSITERAPDQQHAINTEAKQADVTEDGKKAELELIDDDVATQELKQGMCMWVGECAHASRGIYQAFCYCQTNCLRPELAGLVVALVSV